LLPQLSAAIPATIQTIVMLDGHAAPGTGRPQKVAANLEIRHSGPLSADDALLQLVRHRTRMTTLVSDDRALRDKARSLGASTQRLDWLEDILSKVGGASGIGRRR
jgi:rRNA-processing protein FCF1